MKNSHAEIVELPTREQCLTEIEKLFADALSQKPDAVLVVAKVGSGLLIRMAGNPRDVLRIHLEAMEEVSRAVLTMVEQTRMNG